MQVGGHHDAEVGAGLDVDVRIGAPLADQTEHRETLEQRTPDRRPLSDEHQGFGARETTGEHLDVLDVVGEDGHLVGAQLFETPECPEGVEVVVEDCDAHGGSRL